MTQSDKKIVQYLNEAHATEMGLVRVLQEQIAMTPRGRYRSALETHLRETRDHAARVAARRRELQGGGDALGAIVGTAQDAVGQMLALAKAPLDIVRGTSGEEKVLKNAKDACATEALEIATYIALEHLARAAGDTQTAELAVSIRRDEEAMLDAIRGELPALAQAVARRHRRRAPMTSPAPAPADRARRRRADAAGRRARRAAPSDRNATGAARARCDPRGGHGEGRGRLRGGPTDRRLRRPDRRADRQEAARVSQVDLAKVEVYSAARRATRATAARWATRRGPATTR